MQFTEKQLHQLREEFGRFDRLDPESPAMQKMQAFIKSMQQPLLRQLTFAKVKWLSYLARRAVTHFEAGDYAQSVETGWVGKILAIEGKGIDRMARMQGVNNLTSMVVGGPLENHLDKDDTQWFSPLDLKLYPYREEPHAQRSHQESAGVVQPPDAVAGLPAKN